MKKKKTKNKTNKQIYNLPAQFETNTVGTQKNEKKKRVFTKVTVFKNKK